MKKSSTSISIEAIRVKELTVSIVGVSPLICNKFHQGIVDDIIDKQTKKAKVGRIARDPEKEYLGHLYQFEDKKRVGFPAVGFKVGMVRAGKKMGLIMTDIRGDFFVEPDEGDLVEIQGSYRMRTDNVRLASGASDIRFRPEFPKWGAKLRVTYNESSLSPDQIVQMLSIAGFACGIGDWRPEKSSSGVYGRYKIVKENQEE